MALIVMRLSLNMTSIMTSIFFNLFNDEILEDDLKVSGKKLNLLYLKKSTR